MPDMTLFPLPGTFQDKPLSIYTSKSYGPPWAEIREWAAWQFDCLEADVDMLEAFFGGEQSDDDMREALTIKGEVVGVFDNPLTPDEWAALLANSDNLSRARAA